MEEAIERFKNRLSVSKTATASFFMPVMAFNLKFLNFPKKYFCLPPN
jgi:hypothetical protein